MPKIKEILIETMLPAIKAVGKAEMKAVLSGIKNHNTVEIYQTTLQGIHSNFSLLREAAHKSKTRIDDGIIDLVLEAVKESADEESVVLK
ncbi:MAG TPA: hypothetical protein VJ765_04015 [Chitinophagaceae bacterium]|nr:hypothetical protein [Chitinophagaceae bacterium]